MRRKLRASARQSVRSIDGWIPSRKAILCINCLQAYLRIEQFGERRLKQASERNPSPEQDMREKGDK